MTHSHPHALPNLFDLLRADGPDLAMDVEGGNPYSPVWICGLEPNDGCNDWRRFERAARLGCDPAALTSSKISECTRTNTKCSRRPSWRRSRTKSSS